jgi:glycine cleavage system H protein
MNVPANLKYAKTDEWYDPATGAVGITDYAQNHLSDIVFVEILVATGDSVEKGQPIASVESVKASAEIYAPAAGKVSAINASVSEKPELLNSAPFGEGWLIKLEGGAEGDTMDSAAYEQHCAEREH